jgi:hypothetical protein
VRQYDVSGIIMAMVGRPSADLVMRYVPPSTDPILVEWDVPMDCENFALAIERDRCFGWIA